MSEPDLFSKNAAETVSISGSSPSMVKISESNNSVTSPVSTKSAVKEETQPKSDETKEKPEPSAAKPEPKATKDASPEPVSAATTVKPTLLSNGEEYKAPLNSPKVILSQSEMTQAIKNAKWSSLS